MNDNKYTYGTTRNEPHSARVVLQLGKAHNPQGFTQNVLNGLKLSQHWAVEVPKITKVLYKGAQWLSGRVLDSRPRGRGFEPHRRHCVVVLEQDTFILA